MVSLKPNGFQITLPDWWPPTFNESKNFILGMQEVVEDIYMILYNPPHAKVLLSLEEISLLKQSVQNLVELNAGEMSNGTHKEEIY